MNTSFLWATLGVFALVLIALYRLHVRLRREEHIRSAPLPKGLYDKLQKHHPNLTLKDCQLVAHGLRQFFLAHLKSGRKFVSMPSQITDDLWHEFILYTRNYQAFCQKAFGRFLHHTPAVVLTSERQSNAGLRRCWWYACIEENINPRAATRLPLLFALDSKLKIPNGFHYAADCESLRRAQVGSVGATIVYCGGDFSSVGFDGTTDGLGDSGSDGGGDGGGCGGD